jgi:hypothetical protein
LGQSLKRGQQMRAGALTVRMVRGPVGAATLPSGEIVSPSTVAERLRWLAQIVQAAAESRISQAWNDQAVSSISDHGGHAYVAMERAYGKSIWPPEGVHASDRVRRMAEELAGRTVRSAARQIGILEAVLPDFLPIAIWESLPAEDRSKCSLPWPSGTTAVERCNLVRAVRKFELRNHRLPARVYEVLGRPEFKGGYLTCPLDAADDQAVRLTDSQLSVQLPTKEYPSKGDWAWHSLELMIPKFARQRYAGALICRPSLRVTPASAYFLVPLEVGVPEALVSDRLLGVDWGLRKLASCTVVYPDQVNPDRAITTGRPFFFNAWALQTKQYRRRTEAEALAVRIGAIDKLLTGEFPGKEALIARRDQLLTVKTALWQRISRSNHQLAQACALWVVEAAKAEGCGTITLEDLNSLEARELGRIQNGRINLQVRGLFADLLRQKAQLARLRVVSVTPRGTSSLCSRCSRVSVFWHAPDRRSGDPNWLVCACRRSSDRDHAASEAIGARGLDTPAVSAKSRRKPLPGPASHRPIRVQRDKRRAVSALPVVYHQHLLQPLAKDQFLHSETGRRSGGPTSRRVGRGTALVPGQAVSTPIKLESQRMRGPNRPSILDGLSAGYYSAVRFSRVRAIAAPTLDSSNVGL